MRHGTVHDIADAVAIREAFIDRLRQALATHGFDFVNIESQRAPSSRGRVWSMLFRRTVGQMGIVKVPYIVRDRYGDHTLNALVEAARQS